MQRLRRWVWNRWALTAGMTAAMLAVWPVTWSWLLKDPDALSLTPSTPAAAPPRLLTVKRSTSPNANLAARVARATAVESTSPVFGRSDPGSDSDPLAPTRDKDAPPGPSTVRRLDESPASEADAPRPLNPALPPASPLPPATPLPNSATPGVSHVPVPPAGPTLGGTTLGGTTFADTTPDSGIDFAGDESHSLLCRWGTVEAADAVRIEAELLRRGYTRADLELGRFLATADADTRVQLVGALPRMRGIDAGRWLTWLAQDDDVDVRRKALTLLATTADDRLIAKVLARAGQDADPAIRQLAERIADERGKRAREERSRERTADLPQ
jgi:hypothetical protein